MSDWFEPLTSATLSYWNKLTGQSQSVSRRTNLHEACAMSATPAVARWVRGDWQHETVNVICTDFFQISQTVDLCLLRNQRPRRFFLEAPTGLVIDLPRGATAGIRPAMGSRNAPQTASQQWILAPTGHIRSVLDPYMVLDVEGGKATPGASVIL